MFLWRIHTTLMDVFFGLLLLCSHFEILVKMQRLPLIFAGILLPAVLSPMMVDLWIIKGTGNANFLYFQGLCMYVFITIGLIEFLKVLNVKLD
mmetsp:Transcript_8410/g.11759  ORF Transcript_8410/g.11759 Transcript_8410/m.11759 type:complete len:93 (-) Transcript_8410:27-305(-)